jgi:hypothetical protein
MPGMSRQSVPFCWLLSIDSRTPPEVTQRLTGLLGDINHVLLHADHFSNMPHMRHIADQGVAGPIITTRLDSDDGLHPDYLAAVQEAAQDFVGVVDLTAGVRVNHRKQAALRVKKRGRPFVSLVEEAHPIRGVFCAHHNRLSKKIKPTKAIHGGPPWIEVFHEYNKASRWRGRRAKAPWDLVRRSLW